MAVSHGHGRKTGPQMDVERGAERRRRFRPRGPVLFTLSAPPGSPRSGLWLSVPPPQIRSVTSVRKNALWAITGPRAFGAHDSCLWSVSRATAPLWGGEMACPHCAALKWEGKGKGKGKGKANDGVLDWAP